MKTSGPNRLILPAALLCAAGLFSSPLPAAEGSPEAMAAIAKTAENFVEAFNKGDAGAVSAFWTPDGDYVDQEGRVLEGREAIAGAFSKFFADNKGLKVRIESESLSFPAPDTAIEDGTTAVLPANGAPPSRARYTNVFVNTDGKWLLSSVREAAYVPPSHAGHLNALAWAIGEWTDDSNGQEIGHVLFEWTPEGNFIVSTYAVTSKDVLLHRGTQWIGWDSAANQIHSWSFESDGGFGQGAWKEDGGKWVIETSTTLPDGKKMTATNIVSRVDDNTITWQSTKRTLDGKSLPDTEEIKLKRNL